MNRNQMGLLARYSRTPVENLLHRHHFSSSGK
jgi:hypothetical protein